MLERLKEIALDVGLDPTEALQMTVLDFMRTVAERRAARGEIHTGRSEWLRNVLGHCDKATRTSFATMSALGKPTSKVRKAVGSDDGGPSHVEIYQYADTREDAEALRAEAERSGR